MSRLEEKWLLEEKYHGEKTEGFFVDLKRLETGEPLAYLIGHVSFLGSLIHLDSRPLIPRPETEYWVEKAISIIQGKEMPVQVLDLCAGSGCIGVAVAKEVSTAHVDFAEIEIIHHRTIEKNLKENGVEGSHIYGGDLFAKVTKQYNFILSNPPYIDPKVDRVENSVRNHEPHRALYGGENGTKIIHGIIAGSVKHLVPGGQLWLEHEPEQVAEIRSLAIESGFSSVEAFKDQYGLFRYSVLVY